jgi:hypothetical protein
MFGQCFRQCRCPRGLRSDNTNPLGEPAAHGWFDEVPVRIRIVSHRCSGNRHPIPHFVHKNMPRSHQLCVTIAVAFRREHRVRRTAKPADGVLRPYTRIVRVILVVDHHYAGRWMNLPQPFPAKFSRNGIGRLRANDYNRLLRLRCGRVNEQVMAAMRRIELADNKSQTVFHAIPFFRLRFHARTPMRHMPRNTA